LNLDPKQDDMNYRGKRIVLNAVERKKARALELEAEEEGHNIALAKREAGDYRLTKGSPLSGR